MITCPHMHSQQTPLLSINEGTPLEAALPVLSVDMVKSSRPSSSILLAAGHAGERLDQHFLTTSSTDCSPNPSSIASSSAAVKVSEAHERVEISSAVADEIHKPMQQPGMLSQLLNKSTIQSSSTSSAAMISSESIDHAKSVQLYSSQSALVTKTKGCNSCRYRGDGRILVSAHWDNTVRIFDTKHLKPLAVLR
jgi:WD40 repeat protein